MQTYSGYAYHRQAPGRVVVASGTIDKARTCYIDGQRCVAVVGPRGGLRGWILAFLAR